jgi:hypothetical protein
MRLSLWLLGLVLALFPRADGSRERGVTLGGNVAVRDAARRDLRVSDEVALEPLPNFRG